MRFFLLLSCLALVACGSMTSGYRVTPMRTGALYTSKGDVCGIRFENVNFQEGSAKYEQLGLVSLSGTTGDDFTDAMKKDVEKAAGPRGGDAVSVNASAPGVFQFLVWRAK